MDYKTLERDYVKFLEVSYDNDKKEYIEDNLFDNIYKTYNKSYSSIKYKNHSILFNRVNKGHTYIDIVHSLIYNNTDIELFNQFKYKTDYYSFDPLKDEYVEFRDCKMKIQPNTDKKIYYTENYMPMINSSLIFVYIDGESDKELISHIFLDYITHNITIYDYPTNDIYRYTENTSYEGKYKIIEDPCKHNTIMDAKYELDEYGIIKGEEYFDNGEVVESIYKYDTPVSIYENRHENMYCRILADVRSGEISYIYKTLYYKRRE